LADHDGVPKCPSFECNSKFIKDDCKKFSSSKWLEVFIKRLEEAEIPEIPDSEKVYCLYSSLFLLITPISSNRMPEMPPLVLY
jgi:hypothetical protein